MAPQRVLQKHCVLGITLPGTSQSYYHISRKGWLNKRYLKWKLGQHDKDAFADTNSRACGRTLLPDEILGCLVATVDRVGYYSVIRSIVW